MRIFIDLVESPSLGTSITKNHQIWKVKMNFDETKEKTSKALKTFQQTQYQHHSRFFLLLWRGLWWPSWLIWIIRARLGWFGWLVGFSARFAQTNNTWQEISNRVSPQIDSSVSSLLLVGVLKSATVRRPPIGPSPRNPRLWLAEPAHSASLLAVQRPVRNSWFSQTFGPCPGLNREHY